MRKPPWHITFAGGTSYLNQAKFTHSANSQLQLLQHYLSYRASCSSVMACRYLLAKDPSRSPFSSMPRFLLWQISLHKRDQIRLDWITLHQTSNWAWLAWLNQIILEYQVFFRCYLALLAGSSSWKLTMYSGIQGSLPGPSSRPCSCSPWPSL